MSFDLHASSATHLYGSDPSQPAAGHTDAHLSTHARTSSVREALVRHAVALRALRSSSAVRPAAPTTRATERVILLVDPAQVMRELIRIHLVAPGVRVVELASGDEALRAIRSERPDLVVCELHAPGLDAAGLCRELAASPTLRRVPVIALSSDRDARLEQACLEAGAREVLLKPVGRAQLRDAVARHAGIQLDGPGRTGP